MFKVQINSETHGTPWLEFETLEAAEAYVLEVTDSAHWGADATFVISDISAEKELESRLDKARRAKAFGQDVLNHVWALNDSKQLEPMVLVQMMSDPNMVSIERLLSNGMLATAHQLISTLDERYFTESEKSQILNLIVSF